MGLRQTVAPVKEPIDVVTAKNYLRVDLFQDHAQIETMIQAARITAEKISKRQLITATWELTLDRFLTWDIRLPRPRLQSVTSIQYLDADGVSQTLASNKYKVDSKSEPGRITPAYGESWPDTREEMNAVIITYLAGYGTEPATVPAGLRQGMLSLIAHWYENPQAHITGTIIVSVPDSFEMLFRQYRVGDLYYPALETE